MVITRADDVGAVLRRARQEKGWSQQQLASMLGVSRQWVVSVEAGAPNARLGLVIDALRCVDVLRTLAGAERDVRGISAIGASGR